MSSLAKRFHSLPVVKVWEETSDAKSIEFSIPAGLEEAYDYVSGQFCTFAAVISGEKVMRSYSMSSSPELDEPFAVTFKRVPGGLMSNWLFTEVREGDLIDAAVPAGSFFLRDNDRPIVGFCAGSGITPFFAMAKSALATTSRSVSLLYANRDQDSVIFGAELAKLEREFPDRFRVLHHLDDDDAGYVSERECADFAALLGDSDANAADVYICGPRPFMNVAESGVRNYGIAEANIVIERFEADAAVDTADLGPTATEKVEIRIGGRLRTVPYQPGDTLLAAARRAGLNPPFSCQAGNCATCMGMLENGDVSMKTNDVLTEEEVNEGWVLTCQAYPTSEHVTLNYDA